MAEGPKRPIRPRQGGGPGRRRRVVIDTGAARPRPDGRGPRDQRGGPAVPKQPKEIVLPTGPVTVPSGITVREFSQALGVGMQDLIKMLMALGALKTATQSLTDDEVELLAAELKREITIKHADDEDDEPEAIEDDPADLVPRPPVVTIMGHVDHGKTTLLDAIRNAKVVETEAGGITQHIGAYQVPVDGRKVTFLDTPGHEAFTAMRARGAKVTDIAVLVVAADDGVMPQTKESISHARAADVPIVVAVNKIDLPDANPDRVLGELAAEGLQPEEWGGDTQVAQRLGEAADRPRRAAREGAARGRCRARGPAGEPERGGVRPDHRVAARRRPRPGRDDARPARHAQGRRRDRRRRRLGQGPRAPQREGRQAEGREAGRPGRDPRLRQAAAGRRARPCRRDRPRGPRPRAEALRAPAARAVRDRGRPSGITLEGLFEHLQAGEVQDLNIVVKGDVQGSVEAIVSELAKIQHAEVRVNVIHSGVGGITENDINLAAASNGMVVGFNVRPNAETRAIAEREGVEIRTYDVIYKLTEEIEQALVGMLTAVTTEETIGEAEVRNIFRASRVGTIAGCMVTNGVIRRGANVRVIRDSTVVYATTIDSLKRFQDDVREVLEGFECGLHLANYDDVKVGDVLEVFETREVERTSLDEPAG